MPVVRSRRTEVRPDVPPFLARGGAFGGGRRPLISTSHDLGCLIVSASGRWGTSARCRPQLPYRGKPQLLWLSARHEPSSPLAADTKERGTKGGDTQFETHTLELFKTSLETRPQHHHPSGQTIIIGARQAMAITKHLRSPLAGYGRAIRAAPRSVIFNKTLFLSALVYSLTGIPGSECAPL